MAVPPFSIREGGEGTLEKMCETDNENDVEIQRKSVNQKRNEEMENRETEINDGKWWYSNRNTDAIEYRKQREGGLSKQRKKTEKE